MRKELILTSCNVDGEEKQDFDNFFNEIDSMVKDYIPNDIESMVNNYDITIYSYTGKSNTNTERCDVFGFHLGISHAVEEEQERIIDEIMNKVKEIRVKYKKSLVGITLGDFDILWYINQKRY